MNPLSVPCIAMAAVNFYVGAYYLIAYLKRRQAREYLPFALLCLSVAVYDVFCVGLYNSLSIRDGIFWQGLQVHTLAVISICLIWFTAVFTEQKSNRIIQISIVWFTALLLASLFAGPELTLSPTNPAVKSVGFFNLLKITYYEGVVGIVYLVEMVSAVIAQGYLCYLFIRYYQRTHNRAVFLILSSEIIYFLGVVNDSLIATQAYSFVYIGEYGFFLVVLAMAYILLDRFVILHTAHEDLNANLERSVLERTSKIGKLNEDLKRLAERDRKNATALEYERFLLQTLMENLPHSIYFKDTQSRFVRINKSVARIFGLQDASEAIGRLDADFFTEEHSRQALADEQEILRSGEPLLDIEEQETWPDGHKTWVSTSKLPLRTPEGEVVGTFGISRDITDRKQAAVQLQAAKAAAEEASRVKSEFLATMSHEIRTPMNGVIGMIDLLLHANPAPQERMYLELASQSAETLLRLLNDILDFSKIEAGKFELESVGFRLRDTLADTLQMLGGLAADKGLELTYRIPPDIPDDLVGDPSRFAQVVVNLTGNAIKFTERGEIAVDVNMKDLAQDEVCLQFSIRDTGPGIPLDRQKVIFEAFRQADSSMSRQFGGTGLGLAISGQLVELMQGRLWVESEEGQGSTFHFTAILALGRPGAEPTARAADLRNLRILVVDDNQTNRVILEEILCGWHMKPTVVPSGSDALDEMNRAAREGQAYELALLDVMMPEMDGFELAERIRQIPELSDTPLIMLSSAQSPESSARRRQLAIDTCLLKPVKQSDLLDTILSVLSQATANGPVPYTPAPEWPRPTSSLRILLAEDGLVNQKVAQAMLEQAGHQVTLAIDGGEALNAHASGVFDLVLMDVEMPSVDGFEATGIIRTREELSQQHIPIIAMTAHAMKGDRQRCLDAGMDGYLAKPIRAQDLYETMEATIALVTETPQPEVPVDNVHAPLIRDRILQNVGGSVETLKAALDVFSEEVPKLMQRIRAAITDRDGDALMRAAHTLKGSIQIFEAPEAAAAAFRMETVGLEENLDAAEDAWQDLVRETERLKTMLADLALS